MDSAYTHGELPGYIALTLVSEASTGIGYYIMTTGDKRVIWDKYKALGLPLKLDLSVSGRPGLNALYTGNLSLLTGTSTAGPSREDCSHCDWCCCRWQDLSTRCPCNHSFMG